MNERRDCGSSVGNEQNERQGWISGAVLAVRVGRPGEDHQKSQGRTASHYRESV